MTKLLDRPVLPSPQDTELALQGSRMLAALKHADQSLRVQLDDGNILLLPKAATNLIQHLLTEMGQGNAVTLIPVHAELTTQEAADYLNVSRPYLIRLLEGGKVPFRLVGSHRRVKFSDLDAYRKRAEEERKNAMDELAAQSQELGMGY
jgi:excisionase family DNA binding protein